MMAALGTVIMMTGGLVPVFTYCSPLIASLLLIPVMDMLGTGCAWAVWGVTGLLALLTGADKEAAFFYIFFGWYPAVKPLIDAVPSKPLRFGAKVLVFSAAVGVMYGFICFVLKIGEIMETFFAAAWLNALFLAALVAVMLLYDRTLPGIAGIWLMRIKPKIVRDKQKAKNRR